MNHLVYKMSVKEFRKETESQSEDSVDVWKSTLLPNKTAI